MEKDTARRIAERFIRLTPDKRRLFWQKMNEQGVTPAQLPILARDRGEQQRLPVSYAQQRQWFMWQLAPESRAYHVAGGLWLIGEVDTNALRASLEAIVARHEVLRTRFVADEAGRVEQRIDAQVCLDWREQTLPATQIDAAARVLASEPFDLTNGPLLRAGFYRSENGRSLLALALHHIVSDGWSVQVLLKELVAHYRSRVLNEQLMTPALPVQYADYAAWQREWLEAGEQEKQLAYWREALGETHPVLALPTDAPRQAHGSYRAGRHATALPAELARAIRERAQRSSTTPATILLAAFQALLYRYTGEGDIRVGVPVANRNRVETEPLIGFFVNTQVLRAQVTARDTLSELLERTRQAMLEAQAHQDLPFDVLVDALHTQRSLSHNPMFQVMFNHLLSDYRMLDTLPGLAVERYEFSDGEALFELTLNIVESGDGGLSAQLIYARELFHEATIERFCRHYVRLLRALLENPARAVGEVELLDEMEWEQLHSWANGTHGPAGSSLVHRQFEAQAATHPDELAVIFADERLSYRQLNERANRLAARLVREGVGPEVLVGFAMARSVEMLVVQLAILKAGGAYVPLDPAYPPERLAYMIEDSGIQLLLVQASTASRLPPSTVRRMDLDVLDVANEPADESTDKLLREPHADNLAYVVYTSGSTGRPKGVAVAHGALAMHCRAVAQRYEVSAADRYLNFASVSFDAAAEQCFVPLMKGAAIVLRDDEVWSAHRLAGEIRSKGITVVNLPPAYLDAFAQAAQADAVGVRVCIAGGEAWSKAGFDAVRRHLKPQRVFNAYGPSETVITPTLWQPDVRHDAPDGFDGSYAPIGRPVGERSAWVLDARMNLVPSGLPGELYLGSLGMARGYLHRPALTAERFVPDPFADKPGARLYRTGDLVRWRHDGQLEYLGRIDHQVKVRGFRIELGEVEAQLRAQPGVRDAVVDAQEGPGGMRLVGYVSLLPGCAPDTAALRAGLAAKLPDYMVPAALIVLDALPLNPNGKVDRRALPAAAVALEPESGEAAQGAVEEQLAAIWAQSLRRERIGRHENFFELGGDSIMGLQIVARARQAGLALTARQIFEQQTIAQLAACAVAIDKAQADEAGAANTIEPDAPVPLLPIQAWFFAEPLEERQHWNQAVLLRVDQAIDTACMEKALNEVVAHHDSLRLRFEPCEPAQSDGIGWRQSYARSERAGATRLKIATDVSVAAIEALCDATQRTLDLTQGPLLRALVMQIDDGSARLFIAVHHLAIDTVSWRILLDDLRRAYVQLQAGEPVSLPERTTSYQTFGRQLQQAARRPEVERHGEWWLALADVPAALPPRVTHRERSGFRNEEGGEDHSGSHEVRSTPVSATVRFDAVTTSRLLRDAQSAYRSQLADLLLLASGRALCRFAGCDVLRIDLEGHGRETHFGAADLSRTTGWFTAVYPFRLAPTGAIGTALKRVKEARRAVPHGGMSFGMLKYLGSDVQRAALSRVGHAEVLFNYLGQFDTVVADNSNHSGGWQPANERSGRAHSERNRSTHALEITGQIRGDELSLTWLHANGDRYDAATIEALAQDFRRELLTILEHCESGASGVTPSDLPLAALDQARLDDLPMPASEIADIYPLAPMQTGIVFHSLLGQQPGAYVNQLRVDIDRLDCTRFQAAWEAAAMRHDILRTGFLQFDDAPRQWVARSVSAPFTVEDWRDASDQSLAARLDTFAAAQIERGFDLSRPPLWRITLIRTSATRHHLVWTFHHALLDGWSAAQLLAEVLGAYEGRQLAEPPVRYRQFIAWLQTRGHAASEAWWRAQIDGLEGPTLLASALSKPAATKAESQRPVTSHASLGRIWNAEQTAFLSNVAKAQRVTLNTLVQAAWLMLLQRYTGQRTVTFGATVAGRPAAIEGIERTLGLFINTIPVVAVPQPSSSVAEWLEQIQQLGLEAREHEHVALYDIQRWAKLEGGQPLFDSIVVFENYPVDEILAGSTPRELQFSGLRNEDRTSYPLTLSVTHGQHAHRTDASHGEDVLRIEFAYACDAFDAAQIEQIAAHLAALIDAFVANPAAPLGSLTMLSHTERTQVLQWGTGPAVEPAALVHERIAYQAKIRGSAEALVLDGESLDYATLERRANHLAHRLREAGVGRESRVGIAVDRSFEMIIAVLAVLKAGGAYVPLDLAYPAERLAFMIEDSGIELALTAGVSVQALARLGIKSVDIRQALLRPSPAPKEDEAPSINVSRDNLAYIIYTSGSTGRPKGVAITHEALAQHTQVSIGMFGLSAEDRVLQFSTFNFDGFVEQVFATLSVGAALILRGPQLWSSARFLDEVEQQRITVADLTTAYWNALAQDLATHPRARIACRSLRRVHAGGEAMPADGILAWRAAGLDDMALANTYGPSEATVTASAFDCSPYLRAEEVPPRISIGGPLAGRSLQVLDAWLNPVPVGVAGELCIGGALLARGYHGRAALTAERFIADPHAASPGDRLYRTGDLVRWNANGTLDYLGRLDHQVKVRGFRIELGEIEAQLLRLPQVREAVAVVRESASGARVLAYVTVSPGVHPEDGHALRASLAATLPDYMMPAMVLVLDTLPLNPNGKIDRHALPLPNAHDVREVGGVDDAPQGELETALAAIWATVLEVQLVRRGDRFFELGGHSLAAMQVQALIRRTLGIDAQLADLMNNQPLHRLAQTLASAGRLGQDDEAIAAEMQDILAEL
ncbi:non-ribosomal peptide synthetase [Paraburkholderia sp. BCC1885]|uniref:non-ribosomal peptide synthetase n=1 Tax=Paraburkholderia sp. BCC1885 TaxID=2562669 RepID=UPI001184200B|nr:non-ribosomal peptide synthetase [Paraburkholderia sp. BCC1885]